MHIADLAIPDVKIIRPVRHADDRGFFSETHSDRALRDAGIDLRFVQDNHALSRARGTLRGLHFQTPPFAQDKLVRVVRGSIFDVAVDLRVGSPTYGHHVSAILSAENWEQILVPVGFAHGLLTLEPNTEVIYKVSNVYSRQNDEGVAWNDPTIAIDWPIPVDQDLMSEKDRKQPWLADLPAHFRFSAPAA